MRKPYSREQNPSNFDPAVAENKFHKAIAYQDIQQLTYIHKQFIEDKAGVPFDERTHNQWYMDIEQDFRHRNTPYSLHYDYNDASFIKKYSLSRVNKDEQQTPLLSALSKASNQNEDVYAASSKVIIDIIAKADVSDLSFDLAQTDKKGFNALQYAVESQNHELVKAVIGIIPDEQIDSYLSEQWPDKNPKEDKTTYEKMYENLPARDFHSLAKQCHKKGSAFITEDYIKRIYNYEYKIRKAIRDSQNTYRQNVGGVLKVLPRDHGEEEPMTTRRIEGKSEGPMRDLSAG